jgi:hypothetical protein
MGLRDLAVEYSQIKLAVGKLRRGDTDFKRIESRTIEGSAAAVIEQDFNSGVGVGETRS